MSLSQNKLLGQGSFGCVYQAPLECRFQPYLNQKYQNDLMKVMYLRPLSNEDEISAILRLVDPNSKFFIPLSGDYCKIKNPQLHLKNCLPYESSKQQEHFRGYFMRYGGPTLMDYIDRRDIDIFRLWNWMTQGVEAINILHQNQIVHGDLKENNVVIDPNTDQLKLIDFGGSWFTFDSVHATGHYDRNPLFLSVYLLRLNKESRSYMQNILYKDYEHLAEFFIPDYVRGSFNDIINNLIIKSDHLDQYYQTIILPNASKIDLFMWFDCLNNFILNSDEYNYRELFKSQNSDLLAYLVFLINQNVTLDHHKQWTIEQTLEYIRQVNLNLKNRSDKFIQTTPRPPSKRPSSTKLSKKKRQVQNKASAPN